MVRSWLLAAVCSLPLASALPKIHAQGKYLFDESGNRFYIKGVAYQEPGELAPDSEENQANGGFPEPSSYIDPLSLPAACQRDLPFLTQLGVNAIRAYSVDSSLNHDECMAAFDAAGIYAIIDLALPLNGSINRASPAWTTNLQDLYIRTIDAFDNYPNVLAYAIGNEVVNAPTNTDTAPFIKAAARDIKSYLRTKGSSALVTYSTTDGSAYRDTVLQYLTCESAETSVDLIGLNSYRWCGDDTYESSGYDDLVASFQSLPVPAYLSEYGCEKEPPRLWTEVQAIFSQPFSDVFSGGAAFSFFPAQIPNFELVTLSGPNNETVTTNEDFTRLMNQYTSVTGPALSEAAAPGNLPPSVCPPQSTEFLGSQTLPPTPSESVCQCLFNSAFACVPNAAAQNSPILLGALLDAGCSLLGGVGGNCDAISGDGSTGTYGRFSFCDPSVKLGYVFSEYFANQQANQQACDFAGNATLRNNLPTTVDAINSAAEQCLAGFQPTAVPEPPPPRPTGPSGGGNNGGGNNGNNGAFGRDAQISIAGVLAALAGLLVL